MQGGVLRFTKPRGRRNRVVVALLLPALAFVWLVGWSLYWIGHTREAKQKPRAKRRDHVTLFPTMMAEEESLEASVA
jgi:hypothetical protein